MFSLFRPPFFLFLSCSHFTTSSSFLFKLSAVKLKHQRQLMDVKDQFDLEKSRNDTRDVSNSQEIDTLRRKCICLTKL